MRFKDRLAARVAAGVLLAWTAWVLGAGVARADQVPQADWIAEFRARFPTMLCAGYPDLMAERYGFSQDACGQALLEALDVCLTFNRALLPRVFNQPEDGKHWGRLLGECSGTVYEAVLKPRLPSGKD